LAPSWRTSCCHLLRPGSSVPRSVLQGTRPSSVPCSRLGDGRLQPSARCARCPRGLRSAGCRSRPNPAARSGTSVGAPRVVGSMDPAGGRAPIALADRAWSDGVAGFGGCSMAARAVAPRWPRFLPCAGVGADRCGGRYRHVPARGRLTNDDGARSPHDDRPGSGRGVHRTSSSP